MATDPTSKEETDAIVFIDPKLEQKRQLELEKKQKKKEAPKVLLVNGQAVSNSILGANSGKTQGAKKREQLMKELNQRKKQFKQVDLT